MGLLTLAPHGKGRLALLILGNSVEGLMDVVSLATPTIPPMTRSPVGTCRQTGHVIQTDIVLYVGTKKIFALFVISLYPSSN